MNRLALALSLALLPSFVQAELPPEAVKEIARVSTSEGDWGLFWNSNRDG